MQEFINPKSMLTPGVAGSLTMFLVNGVAFQFPEVSPRYLALFLSFLIGSIVWFSEVRGKLLIPQKVVYWILNSLVIFVVGFGTANWAADATAGASNAEVPHVQLLPLVSTAFAQSASPQASPPSTGSDQGQATIDNSSGSQSLESLREQLMRERNENDRLKNQVELMKKKESAPMQPEGKNHFFKRW